MYRSTCLPVDLCSGVCEVKVVEFFVKDLFPSNSSFSEIGLANDLLTIGISTADCRQSRLSRVATTTTTAPAPTIADLDVDFRGWRRAWGWVVEFSPGDGSQIVRFFPGFPLYHTNFDRDFSCTTQICIAISVVPHTFV